MALANDRRDQENVIEQLKNGVNAMRMPADDLLSNWAYMVMSALAWNLKAGMDCLCPIANEVWNYSGWSSVASCTSLCRYRFNRAQRSADYLPDHGLQRVAQRLLRYLGVPSQDSACLK